MYLQHDVVLDYVTTHALASTAKVLSRPRTQSLPTDGDEDVAMDVDTGSGSGSSSRKSEKRPRRREKVLSVDSLQSIERRRGKLFV